MSSRHSQCGRADDPFSAEFLNRDSLAIGEAMVLADGKHEGLREQGPSVESFPLALQRTRDAEIRPAALEVVGKLAGGAAEEFQFHAREILRQLAQLRQHDRNIDRRRQRKFEGRHAAALERV